MSITITNIGHVDRFPDKCPFCHDKITPQLIGQNTKEGNIVRLIFICPSVSCREVFISYYKQQPQNPVRPDLLFYYTHTGIGKLTSKSFHQSINEVSSAFVEIYNQAFASEQYGLLQICGVGYRKALEFLIKDFAIKNNSEKKEEIEKLSLAKVIKDYISDTRIKTVAERAVWIGNDETHYVRKWETKDLTDLKNLIDLTLTMIQSEFDYEELTKSMPVGR